MYFRRLLHLTLLLALTAACSNPQKAAQKYVERGNKYAAENKHSDAFLQYRNAVEKDPMNAEARKKLGEAYLRSGNARAGLNHMVRAADLAPDDAETQLAAGSLLLLTGQFEDAGQRASKVLDRHPDNVAAHVLKANSLAGLRDLASAVKQLEQAVSLDPTRMASYANLGAIEAMGGHHEKAEAAFKKAIEVAPNDIQSHLAIANYYWAMGRKADVEASLAAALRIDPKHVGANSAMAMFKMVSGDTAAAETHFKAVVANSKEPSARLTLADFYISQKRVGDATPILDELAKQPESFGAATSRLAALAYDRGERDKAYQLLETVIAKEPRNARNLAMKGAWQLSEGRKEEAQKTAAAAVQVAPDSVEAHFLAGTVNSQRGQVDDAIKEFQEVLRLNPRAAIAELQLSRLHASRGGHEAARQHAQAALKAVPQSPIARLELVRSLIATGDAKGAERELAPLAATAKDTYEYQLALGRIALARQDFSGAQAPLERAVALKPTGAEALAHLTALEARNKRLPRAEALVDAALKAQPNDPALSLLSANIDAVEGQAALAEGKLRRIIDSSPDFLPAYELLAQIYLRQNNLDGARREYERLAGRAPKSIGPPTMVAMLDHVQGKEKEAIEGYRKVLDMDARAVVANNNLAYIYAERETDLDLALQMAQAAKAASPDNADINDTLGWVYYKKGMPSLSIGPLLQSIRLEPSKPIYHYHLGLAYDKTGQRDKARAALQQALTLGEFPEAAAARKALEALR